MNDNKAQEGHAGPRRSFKEKLEWTAGLIILAACAFFTDTGMRVVVWIGLAGWLGLCAANRPRIGTGVTMSTHLACGVLTLSANALVSSATGADATETIIATGIGLTVADATDHIWNEWPLIERWLGLGRDGRPLPDNRADDK